MKNLHTKSSREVSLDTFGKVGVFSASLLVAATAAYFYSPVIKSNAAEDSAVVEVSAEVGEVISLALDTNALALSVSTPTSAGVFTEGTITATTTTNSTGGYELYFSSVNDETDMVHENSSISNVIASDFSGTVTDSTMAKNKWGYSLDDTNFSAIPTYSEGAKIRDIDHLPSAAEKSTAVQFGAKISAELPSGKYKKNVIFSAVAHPTPTLPTLADISTMQQMTSSTCAATAIGTTATLTDTRDGNTYTVFKGRDGNCWMSQNLRLINKTITSADSNIASGTSFTVPNNNWADSLDGTDKYNNAYTYQTSNTDYGVYYNYAAVTAGTITGEENTDNATYDICPKGWKLPSHDQQETLLTVYNVTNDATGSTIMRSAPLNFIYSGNILYDDTSLTNQEEKGYWWSSTSHYTTNSYNIYITDSYAYAHRYNRRNGIPVRCVAAQPSLQGSGGFSQQ